MKLKILKLHIMVQIGQYFQTFLKWMKLVGNHFCPKMVQTCQKWFKPVKTRSNLSKVLQTYYKWFKIVKIIQFCSKLEKNAKTFSKWIKLFRLVQTWPKWLKRPRRQTAKIAIIAKIAQNSKKSSDPWQGQALYSQRFTFPALNCCLVILEL